MNMNTIETFLAALSSADAVSIDDGPLLTSWETTEVLGTPGNEIARFSWSDSDCEYSDILTEDGISDGRFIGNKFLAENSDGEKTVVRFFQIKALPISMTGLQVSLDDGKSWESSTGVRVTFHDASETEDSMEDVLLNITPEGVIIDVVDQASGEVSRTACLPLEGLLSMAV